MALYSTVGAAKKLGIGRLTLLRWLKEGLQAPPVQTIGGVRVRLWDNAALRRAKAYKRRRYHKKNY